MTLGQTQKKASRGVAAARRPIRLRSLKSLAKLRSRNAEVDLMARDVSNLDLKVKKRKVETLRKCERRYLFYLRFSSAFDAHIAAAGEPRLSIM
jgi:hypothetical protein